MSNYILNTDNKEKVVAKIVKTKSYTFSSKNKKYKYVKNISVYNPDKIQKILLNKLIKRINKLDKVVFLLSEEDDTTAGDIMACLDENYRIQEILKTKYQEYLTKEYFDYFLNKLVRDSKILEQCIVEMNYQNSCLQDTYSQEENENRKGR